MDRLEEWRIFVGVAGQRSFVKAARLLGRSPQATTRAVAALEARLRTRLLHRTTRAVSLTTDGERYLERARRAIGEMDALELSPTEDRDAGVLRGVVTVTAPVLFGQLHVVPVITKLLTQHAELSVRLLLLDRIVALAEEGIDVAVRIGALPDSALRAQRVGRVRSLVCASPRYVEQHGKPRDPESLARGHACIAWNAAEAAERWSFRHAESGALKSVVVHPRLTVNSGQAAIDAALAHVGIVRVLSYQVERLVAQDKLVVLLRAYEPAPMPIHLVQLPGVQARIVGAFVSELASALTNQNHT